MNIHRNAFFAAIAVGAVAVGMATAHAATLSLTCGTGPGGGTLH